MPGKEWPDLDDALVICRLVRLPSRRRGVQAAVPHPMDLR